MNEPARGRVCKRDPQRGWPVVESRPYARAVALQALALRTGLERIDGFITQLPIAQQRANWRATLPRVIGALEHEECCGVGEARGFHGRFEPGEVVLD